MKNSAIGSLPSVLSTEECTDTEKHTKIVIIYINKGNCNCISQEENSCEIPVLTKSDNSEDAGCLQRSILSDFGSVVIDLNIWCVMSQVFSSPSQYCTLSQCSCVLYSIFQLNWNNLSLNITLKFNMQIYGYVCQFKQVPGILAKKRRQSGDPRQTRIQCSSLFSCLWSSLMS